MKSRIKYSIICLIWIISIHIASAQYSRFTVDAKVGTTFTTSSVISWPGSALSVGLRYAPLHLMSITVFTGVGALWGRGNVRIGINGESTTVTERLTFNTEYITWGSSVYLNLRRAFATKESGRVIPYLYAGIGYLAVRSESRNSITRLYHFMPFTSLIGFEIRIRGTSRFDFLASIQENFTQTVYMDAIPYDGRYDHFMTLSGGISYKLSFAKKREYIDWSRAGCPGF
jgi:hypothetical protein